jgi:hypothetical protein
MARVGHGAMSDLSPFLGERRTLTKTSRRRCAPARLSQDFRAKRDSRLINLTAWIASFVRVPAR